jgi:hypothetical protein
MAISNPSNFSVAATTLSISANTTDLTLQNDDVVGAYIGQYETSSPGSGLFVLPNGGVDTSNPIDTSITSATGQDDFTPDAVDSATTYNESVVVTAHAGTNTASGLGKAGGAPSNYTLSVWAERSQNDTAFSEIAWRHIATASDPVTIGVWTGTPDDATSNWHVHSIAFKAQGDEPESFTTILTDLNGLTDNLLTADHFEREVQDPFTFVDQQRMAGVISFEVNAGGAFDDNLDHTLTEAGAGPSLVADPFTFVDQIETADHFEREVQDLSGLTDQIQTRDVLERELQDLSGLSDQIRTADVIERELADSSTFVDQIETEQAYIEREIQDDITLSDQIRTSDIFDREVQDSNVLVDQIRTGDVPEREVQDSFSFSDVLETEFSFFEREISDDLDFVENLDHSVTGQTPPSLLADISTFADQIRTADHFEREVSDSSTFVDQIRTGDVPEREVQDSFSFSDQIEHQNCVLDREMADASTFVDNLTHSEPGVVDLSTRIKTYFINELIP